MRALRIRDVLHPHRSPSEPARSQQFQAGGPPINPEQEPSITEGPEASTPRTPTPGGVTQDHRVDRGPAGPIWGLLKPIGGSWASLGFGKSLLKGLTAGREHEVEHEADGSDPGHLRDGR